jgi:hypothetical protein
MRLHYAHSMSVGVVIAVFQHIFFTGALSVNWPSVLVAWWSNFAWAGGMIHSASMQTSINHLIGNNVGNTSQVGAAGSGTSQDTLGGGYDISQIYRRALGASVRDPSKHPLLRNVASEIYRRPEGVVLKRDLVSRHAQHMLATRDLPNATTGYSYYGHPVGAGLPLPGNYSGFAGTLAQESIRTSNAFMTGFLWFLILLVILVAAMVALKWTLEGLARIRWVRQDRLKFFRDHWRTYCAALALRMCYLAFFMMMFLTIFQFTYNSSGGVKAVAAIVFLLFLVGIPAISAYAVLYKKHIDTVEERARDFRVERKTLLGKVPWFSVRRIKFDGGDEHSEQATQSKSSSKPFWKRALYNGSIKDEGEERRDLHSVHDNDDYTMKFGWLASRFRRTRWWFFTVWIVYEFGRAIFYGGASGYPLAQVFGLLVIEFLAFCGLIWARPFEGQRLNIIVVYCLGFSKVASVALSAAFDTQFSLPRIITTVIGIVIIVIQGILTIITMIAIVVGAISSYMSISRNREDFRPRKWARLRENYFDHLDRVVNDLPKEPKAEPPPTEPEEEKEPYFEMKSMRRLAKIEDEDPDITDPAASYATLDASRVHTPSRAMSMHDNYNITTPAGRSRAPSVQSMSQTTLPFGARPHRPSWSTRDFTDYSNDHSFTPVDMSRNVPDEPRVNTPPPAGGKGNEAQTPSRRATLPLPKVRPQPSTDSLRIGGEVSTRDTIGNVPAPKVRPRAGTGGSLRGSRTFTPTWADSSDGDIGSQPGSQRASRHPPLTPAQEQEEFGLSVQRTRDH